MALERFPGRPGQRIGDDSKLSAETCIPATAQNNIEMGSKLFYDLFGYSDEEEDFDGFTLEEVAQSEAKLALKLRQNKKLQSILDSNNSSPATSEIEKFSSYSESSSSSLRPIKSKHISEPNATKYSSLRNSLPTINENESLKNKSNKIAPKGRPAIPLDLDSIGYNAANHKSSNSLSVAKEPLKPKIKRPFTGNKRFVLPLVSARSSRKIIPRKRYIEEYDFSDTKVHEEVGQCSRSSLSCSSEKISAMDGGSSPDNSQLEDARQSRKFQKKIGLLDRPLVVEGKRAWKPSLKVQMKLSQMNCELKKNLDAEKVAQKPKERPFKILESFKRSVSQNIKSVPEMVYINSSDNAEDGKDKVAAKIEKLQKSQWKRPLKDPSAKLPTKVESPVEQWMSEQQERTSTQKRTKAIIRKARLQLKKRNLNLRTRKTDKDLSNATTGRINVKADQALTEKADSVAGTSSVAGLPLEEVSKPSTCILSIGDTETLLNCVICGNSKMFSQSGKLYDRKSCGTCSKFFSSFADSPKQYFCTKDGDCSIKGSGDTVSRKLINSRCKACWLKICMEKFTVSSHLRDQLLKYVPRLNAPPHNALLFVDNTDKAVVGVRRGPRVKHVCRRAAVVLGLPRATFSDTSAPKESFNLSALPQEEKQKVLETVLIEENALEAEAAVAICDSKPSTSVSKIGKQHVKKKSRKDIKVKKLDLLKKCTPVIQKEQKSAVKTSPKLLSKRPFRSGKMRYRRCHRPIMAASKKKPHQDPNNKHNLFESHSSLSSSSSPTSSCSSTSSSSNGSSSNNVSLQSEESATFLPSAVTEPTILQDSECVDTNVVTNPVFQLSTGIQELVEKDSESSVYVDLVGKNIGKDCQPMFKEAGDTILFEGSSSLIELKNASYAPSLLYGGAGDPDDSVSYTSYAGSKSQNNSRNPRYSREQDQYGSAAESISDEDEEEEEDLQQEKHYI